MTIHDRIFIYKKTAERHRKDVLGAILLILTATLCLGVGYIIGQDSQRAPIIIQKCANQ